MEKRKDMFRQVAEQAVQRAHQDAQVEAFTREQESIESFVELMRRRVKEELLKQARVLVVDVSKGKPGIDAYDQLGIRGLTQHLKDHLYNGEDTSHARIFQRLLGFDIDDPRFDTWDITKDVDRDSLPYPDAVIITGGGAMPSEMDPGQETENTAWLKRASSAIEELRRLDIPMLAVCLGHQLTMHSVGTKVGPQLDDMGQRKREFGTVSVNKQSSTPDIQLLTGVFDDNEQFRIAASHSEGMLESPPAGDAAVLPIAWNDYSPYQGYAIAPPTDSTESVATQIQAADARDALSLSIQNHPELSAFMLRLVGILRGKDIAQEGIDLKNQIFTNTPQARQILKNFLDIVIRRQQK